MGEWYLPFIPLVKQLFERGRNCLRTRKSQTKFGRIEQMNENDAPLLEMRHISKDFSAIKYSATSISL